MAPSPPSLGNPIFPWRSSTPIPFTPTRSHGRSCAAPTRCFLLSSAPAHLSLCSQPNPDQLQQRVNRAAPKGLEFTGNGTSGGAVRTSRSRTGRGKRARRGARLKCRLNMQVNNEDAKREKAPGTGMFDRSRGRRCHHRKSSIFESN